LIFVIWDQIVTIDQGEFWFKPEKRKNDNVIGLKDATFSFILYECRKSLCIKQWYIHTTLKSSVKQNDQTWESVCDNFKKV